MKNQLKTILFLEDDPNDILLIERAVQKLNLAVNIRFCSDGDEGTRYLRGEDEYINRSRFPLPDLIILDIKLPGQSGLEVAKWIKAAPEHKHTPVIMMSSSGQPGDITKAYENGANSFLVKPVEFNQFVAMLETCFKFWIEMNHGLNTIA